MRNFRKEGIKDGDYVYGPNIEGVFYVTINQFKLVEKWCDIRI
jgi:hypothetical protein